MLLTNCGGLLQILGHKEEAETFYRDALSRNPHFYAGYYGLKEIYKIKDASDPLLLQARKVADSTPPETDKITVLYYALASMYFAIKEDAQGWHFLHKAKEILRKKTAYNPALWDSKLAQTIEFFSAEYFSQPLRKARPHPHTQPLFIVGMPRSGTTLVEQILSSHSEVTARGELRDLDIMSRQMKYLFGTAREYPEVLLDADDEQLQRIADHYYNVLLQGVAPDQRYAIDKLPFNFYRLGLIYQLFPRAKIVHCTRNPMDTCFSIYTYKFTNTLEWMLGLDRIAHYYNGYRKLMAHWEKVFPMPIHTVAYEDMVADQRGQTEKLLSFLELDWEDNCLQFHQNERAVSTASAWQVRQPIYTKSVEKWRRHEQELQPFIQGIGQFAHD